MKTQDLVKSVRENFESHTAPRFSKRILCMDESRYTREKHFLYFMLFIDRQRFTIADHLSSEKILPRHPFNTILTNSPNDKSLLDELNNTLRTMQVILSLPEAGRKRDNLYLAVGRNQRIQEGLQSSQDLGGITIHLRLWVPALSFTGKVNGVPLNLIFCHDILQKIFEGCPPPTGKLRRREFF